MLRKFDWWSSKSLKKKHTKWDTRSSEYWIGMYWKRIKEVFTEECKKFVKWDLEDLEFIERSSQNVIKKL